MTRPIPRSTRRTSPASPPRRPSAPRPCSTASASWGQGCLGTPLRSLRTGWRWTSPGASRAEAPRSRGAALDRGQRRRRHRRRRPGAAAPAAGARVLYLAPAPSAARCAPLVLDWGRQMRSPGGERPIPKGRIRAPPCGWPWITAAWGQTSATWPGGSWRGRRPQTIPIMTEKTPTIGRGG